METTLSIVCITYNQVKYIKQALDGFIMQKTKFPFIAIVSDDCSTDGTREIIKEYAEKYPEIIKPILRENNLGAIENFADTLNMAKSKYVAICEGDDYWTDPQKLQKQVDFLENNPQYSGCFHPVDVIWEGIEKEKTVFPSEKMMKNKDKITFEDELIKNHIQTNSVVYRWEFNEKDIKDVFPSEIMPGDYYVHLLHAKNGDIAYLKDNMAVYRRHANGIWWEAYKDIDNLHLKHGIKEINFYHNVYKNIADSSDMYLNKKLLPETKNIMDTYYQYGDFDSLNKIKDKYPDYFEKALKINFLKEAKEKLKKKSKQYKKYKKLFKIFLIMFICALIALIIFGLC